MRTRNSDKYSELGHSTFASIDEVVAEPIKDGLNSIHINGREFDYFYRDRGQPVTIVTFSAAMSQSMPEYPIFSGRELTAGLETNWLAFSDTANGGENSLPTFWHLGTEKVNALEFIPKIIEHAVMSGAGRHLLFFGSSAGGFAALNFSRFFPGSAALVLNPRVNILNEPKLLPKYAPIAYPNATLQELNETLPLNLAKIYSQPQGNYIVYLQNMQDPNYSRHHYAHFKKATDGRADVQFVIDNWGKGHVTPPRCAYMQPLQSMVDSAPNWSSAHDVYEGYFL